MILRLRYFLLHGFFICVFILEYSFIKLVLSSLGIYSSHRTVCMEVKGQWLHSHQCSSWFGNVSLGTVSVLDKWGILEWRFTIMVVATDKKSHFYVSISSYLVCKCDFSVVALRQTNSCSWKVKRPQIISHRHAGKRAHFIRICPIRFSDFSSPPHGSASHRSHVSPVSWSG